MGILKCLKNLFRKENSENDSDQKNEESIKSRKEEVERSDLLDLNSPKDKVSLSESKRDVNEELKALRRKKYAQSNFNLENRLECDILNYLLGNECNCFNVYWNLYIPYNLKRYMQIDHLVVTGDTVYSIECKDYQNCTSIEVFAEHWECYYRSGKVYKSVNGVSQNTKHISILRKYLKEFNLDFKSIVILVVDDDFDGYIPNDEVILVRNKEFELIFKLLDRKLKYNCDESMDLHFVELNKKIYECMNPTEATVNSHKDYIKQRYN